MSKTVHHAVTDFLGSSEPFHKLGLEKAWNAEGWRREGDTQRWVGPNEKILGTRQSLPESR
jgi:hypothetical protein